MAHPLTQFASPPNLRSSLFKNPPDSVPPTDVLEELHSELKLLKTKALERAKKAEYDLRFIEESMKRMKEKEKGKAKAVDKVKKERDFTPIPAEEPKLPQSLPPRPRVVGGTPVPSTSAKPLLDPRKSLSKAVEDTKKKKKKRKREAGESEDEREPQRIRKGSPTPSIHIHTHKASKGPPNSLHLKPSGPDFGVPQPVLVPSRPPVPPPPTPGPSKPTDVNDDFSKVKPPAQVLVTTFYSSIEPWLRPIKEEDVGFLEYTADEVEPYVMPKLGRHYSEVWEEEDIAYYGMPLTDIASVRAAQVAAAATSSSTGPLPKWDPSTLTESDAVTEEKGHGPFTERLLSALLPIPDSTVWKGVKAAEDAMEGRPGITGAAFAAAKEKVNVADLEERIKDSARFYGLITEKPDYSEAIDDPISAALRQAQRQLRTVVATNKARKNRLAAVARDRLGYQEYLDLRDSIDKNIISLYTKLQKKDAPKVSKKKKKGVEVNGNASANGSANANATVNGNGNGSGSNNTVLISSLPPCPAALGLGPDDELKLTVPAQLKQLVNTRRQWVDAVGSVFEEKERENPGRIYGLPQKSLYEGLEEDIRKEEAEKLKSTPADTRTKGSSTNGDSEGKGRARGDEMEVG
ncbi:hypothetical protein GLOTRDRAFT_141416 [Gloeophyllum trabeum ATCC 11539]|uniref:Uncharacterized protein n=1 Tax=Gloeophyllum trabeum (strain ATCC 11539 / FP-39264 / Madison 617) TaxID=670483 RepID=S7RDU4_GLOTA|nr:uncharacterized protein GLOTRDRAFT_141416 [Gloeophyllum trabeum ATCC 11539]EPQ50614.1 hypothetical protein GLOTRDRAFT_141416 [Gloeophyllum trabeum ATCC 11539]